MRGIMSGESTYKRVLPATLVGLLMLAACEDGPTGPVALHIAIYGGDGQVAPTGSMLPTPLAVRVTDGSGRPVPDVKIRWSALDHGAMTAAPSPSVTDGSGIAMVYRTLSSNAGTHTTTATIDGVAEALVRFTSIAQIQGATQIALHPVSSGNSQSDTVLTTLSPYRVVVRDHNNAPVAGVVVSWTGGGSSSGSGSLSSATSTTDASGVAEVRHTLGKEAGRYVIQAVVPGLVGSPVSFE
ncbi:MAG: Ig-like domain-containing protein, partial [Gemmatimonadetes bacterium]|nr:Ig-like domain-containing protein [Gemmatimonadota bacterium]